MEFVDIANQYAREDLGQPVLSDEKVQSLDDYIPSSMASAVKQASSREEAEDWIMATMGAWDFLENLDDGEEGTTKKKKNESLLHKILHWLGKKIEHRMEKAVFRFIRNQIFKVIRWIVDETIKPIFRYAMEELVAPILETIVSAIVSPELLIAAGIGAVAVGLGFVGEWLFKKYFQSGMEPAGDSRVGYMDPSASAAPRMPAGAAQANTQYVPPPPMRPGIAGKTYSQLEALIQSGESSKKGYDDYNFSSIGSKHGYAGKPVSQMTIQEVQSQQSQHNYNAVGRYQMIATTLDAAVEFLHLDPSTTFDMDTQDYIFESYLITRKQQEIGDYISGKSDDLWGAVYAASKEWASVAAPPSYPLYKGGVSDGLTSYYSGLQGNKASISAIQMAQTLQQERQNYQLANGGKSSVQDGVATQQVNQQQAPAQSSGPTAAVIGGSQGYTTPNIIKHQGVLLAVNG